MENKLFGLWKRDKDQLADDTLKQAFAELQADAETLILQKKKAKNVAQKKVDDLLMEAAKKANFDEIVKASIELEAADMEYTKAIEVYKDMFSESPKFA